MNALRLAALALLVPAWAAAQNTQTIAQVIERADDAEAVKRLLDAGADRNARTQWNETLVERALFRKRWAIARALADAKAPLQAADESACAREFWKCHSIQAARLATLDAPTLKYLKERGLDLERAAMNGHTALTSLLVEPSSDAARVRALLEAGADPNRRFRELTPLMLAVAVPQQPRAIADAIAEAGGRVEFDYAIPKASPDELPKAFALPATPSAAMAALSEPVVRDYSGILKGRTVGPLTWLVLYRRGDVASRILAREPKLAPADRYLLYFAARFGEWDLVLEAIKYVREVDAGDRAGVTPLLMAAEEGRADAVKALIAAGANVNARSDRDWPPLWETPPSMLFMGHGPSKLRLVGGYTPLKIARELGREDVARILKGAGARE